VQHELAVAVIDPLAIRSCRRIKGGRLGVLVEIRKVVVREAAASRLSYSPTKDRLPICGAGRSDITMSRLIFGNCAFNPSSNPTKSSLTSSVDAPA